MGGKRWTFDEFNKNPATVMLRAETTDDMIGVVDTPAVDTTIGASGVIQGELQAWTGGETVAAARLSSEVNYVYFPDAVYPLTRAHFLRVGGRDFEVVWGDDEGGDGDAPIIYLKRVE